MPRGTHANSLANLKKGKRFERGDGRAAKEGHKGGIAVSAQRSIAEEMKALLEENDKNGNSRKKALAARLVVNMEKSPEWYKLGLRMIGEMPPEQVEVSRQMTDRREDDPLTKSLREEAQSLEDGYFD